VNTDPYASTTIHTVVEYSQKLDETICRPPPFWLCFSGARFLTSLLCGFPNFPFLVEVLLLNVLLEPSSFLGKPAKRKRCFTFSFSCRGVFLTPLVTHALCGSFHFSSFSKLPLWTDLCRGGGLEVLLSLDV